MNDRGSPWSPRAQRAFAFASLVLVVGVALLLSLSRLASSTSPGTAHRLSPPLGAVPIEAATLAPDMVPAMSAAAAIEINHTQPDTNLAIPAATPFLLPEASDLDWLRAVDCLASAVYYEAAGEPWSGQSAVAQVVLNRVRLPHFPKTICGVVFQGAERSTGCQFSFTCDGSMLRVPSTLNWQRARLVAVAALTGYVNPQVGWATHFHADYVAPYWAPRLTKIKTIGRHIFYGWPTLWNRPGAFTQAYSGDEGGLPANPMATVALGGSATEMNAAPADRLVALAGKPLLLASGQSPTSEGNDAVAQIPADTGQVEAAPSPEPQLPPVPAGLATQNQHSAASAEDYPKAAVRVRAATMRPVVAR
jgi:hypothetical protein